MSSMTQQYLSSDDLRMLKRVLDNAGLHDQFDEYSRLIRMVAGRHLIASFQLGIASEMELNFELLRFFNAGTVGLTWPAQVPGYLHRSVQRGFPFASRTAAGTHQINDNTGAIKSQSSEAPELASHHQPPLYPSLTVDKTLSKAA